MKIQAKISIVYDCQTCGERCEIELDFPWIDETKIFRCDFCGAASKIQFVSIQQKEAIDD
jgi:transcription elongation factor Elf1